MELSVFAQTISASSRVSETSAALHLRLVDRENQPHNVTVLAFKGTDLYNTAGIIADAINGALEEYNARMHQRELEAGMAQEDGHAEF